MSSQMKILCIFLLSFLAVNANHSQRAAAAEVCDSAKTRLRLELGFDLVVPGKSHSRDLYGINLGGKVAAIWPLHKSKLGLVYRAYRLSSNRPGGSSEAYHHFGGLLLGREASVAGNIRMSFGVASYLVHSRLNRESVVGPPLFRTHSREIATSAVIGVSAGLHFSARRKMGVGCELEYNRSIWSDSKVDEFSDVGGVWFGLFLELHL